MAKFYLQTLPSGEIHIQTKSTFNETTLIKLRTFLNLHRSALEEIGLKTISTVSFLYEQGSDTYDIDSSVNIDENSFIRLLDEFSRDDQAKKDLFLKDRSAFNWFYPVRDYIIDHIQHNGEVYVHLSDEANKAHQLRQANHLAFNFVFVTEYKLDESEVYKWVCDSFLSWFKTLIDQWLIVKLNSKEVLESWNFDTNKESPFDVLKLSHFEDAIKKFSSRYPDRNSEHITSLLLNIRAQVELNHYPADL